MFKPYDATFSGGNASFTAASARLNSRVVSLPSNSALTGTRNLLSARVNELGLGGETFVTLAVVPSGRVTVSI